MNSRYSLERTREVDCESFCRHDYPHLDRERRQFEDWLEGFRIDFCHQIYRNLEDEYDALTQHDIEAIVIPSRQEKRTISLEEAFETAFVISNHLPNREDNRGIIKGRHFRLMRPGAVFVNTGRGAQVDETEMIAVLKERPDLTVLLDVTWPEPPAADSELYRLPNVHLSSHIAGSIGNEVVRMADFVIADYQRFVAGEPLQYEVTESMLMTN